MGARGGDFEGPQKKNQIATRSRRGRDEGRDEDEVEGWITRWRGGAGDRPEKLRYAEPAFQ